MAPQPCPPLLRKEGLQEEEFFEYVSPCFSRTCLLGSTEPPRALFPSQVRVGSNLVTRTAPASRFPTLVSDSGSDLLLRRLQESGSRWHCRVSLPKLPLGSLQCLDGSNAASPRCPPLLTRRPSPTSASPSARLQASVPTLTGSQGLRHRFSGKDGVSF